MKGEVTPRCAHFGECGGCTWQHIPYPEQLRRKSDLVTRLVRAAVPHSPVARATIPATPIDHPWGYRNKVHFVFGSDAPAFAKAPAGKWLIMGHYALGSRRVIPVRECPVHDQKGNALAFRLRDAYAAADVAAAPDGALKGLAIRVGQGAPEVMATLVVSEDSDRRIRRATRRVLEAPEAPSAFHVNLHPRGDAFIFGRETRRIAGPARMRENVAGISFLISPTSFFQTNVRAAEILVGLVRDAIPRASRVLDLYAGAGLFALPLARAGHTVVAVEENRTAVEDGEASRALNRIAPDTCRFIAGRVEKAVRTVSRSARGRPVVYDAVVMDPPREGCSPSVIDGIFGDLAPPKAVYVSCEPEALARDLAALVRLGYRVESLQPVDMFPHTAHVETVAILNRKP